MLKNLELHNFKSHRDTKIEFDDSRLHALVGQNSSGKTSVLQALYYLAKIDYQDHDIFALDDVFNAQAYPDYIVSIGQSRMSVGASGHSLFLIAGAIRNWRITCLINRSSLDSKWTLTKDIHWEGTNRGSDYTSRTPDSLRSAPQDLKSAVHLKLSAANLAKATYSEEIIPRMEPDGTGLAPTLDYLRNEAPENFEALQKQLKEIVPGVVKIGIRRAKVIVNRQQVVAVKGKSIPYEEQQEMVGQEVILDMTTGERIPAHALSEGTVLTLGLLTVLHNPHKQNLLLLDDIEQGLHPKAQRDLMTVLKRIIADNPDLQIVFSTHSPYIVDEVEPSQVHVLSNDKSGFARCKRLDEHPDIEWAKRSLTTGEFWNAEGEDWVNLGEGDA
jgi:predicted ATPase